MSFDQLEQLNKFIIQRVCVCVRVHACVRACVCEH